MPPCLAGREQEQALLQARLRDLGNGIPPGTQLVLNGPRGNGKTVLLDWLEQTARSGSAVETAILQPAGVSGEARLRELLTPKSWWSPLAAGEITVAGLSWKPGTTPAPATADILRARAEANPLVLLVDEAHVLEIEVGRALLHAAQEAGRKLPFLLVLAGTPNLETRLDAMDASFWSRADQIRIGRLREPAAAEALRRPFEDAGIEVEPDALETMVRESQRYPYFVQLIGSAVWKEAVAGADDRPRVTARAVTAGRRAYERTKREYYAHRFREMARRRLLAAGVAVADAFCARTVLDHAQVEAAVARGLGITNDPERVERTIGGLRDLGYIWWVEGEPRWEPGIPSLMDYVCEYGRAPAGRQPSSGPGEPPGDQREEP